MDGRAFSHTVHCKALFKMVSDSFHLQPNYRSPSNHLADHSWGNMVIFCIHRKTRKTIKVQGDYLASLLF